MEVKIDTNYAPAEVRELCAMLVTSGLVSPQEMEREAAFYHRLEIDFLNINELLLPFQEKFVGHSMDDRDLTIRLHGHDYFYWATTLRLLQASPLVRHAPKCTIDHQRGELTVRASQLTGGFALTTYPAYCEGVLTLLNWLLQQDGVDAAYYEIGFDDATYFLLLTKAQHQGLLTNRVLRFRGVEYPEIDAWRATLTDEDLAF